MIHLDEHLRRALSGPYLEERNALFSLEMYDKVTGWAKSNPAEPGSESIVVFGSWSVKILKECDPRDASKVVELLRAAQLNQPGLCGLNFVLGSFSESPTAVVAAGRWGNIYFFNHLESGRLFASALQEVSETTIERLIYHELAHVADNLKVDQDFIADIVLANPEELKHELLKLNRPYFTEINKLFAEIDPTRSSKKNIEKANYIAGEAVAEIFACLQTGGIVPDYEAFKSVQTELAGDYREHSDLPSVPLGYTNGRPFYRGGM